MQAFYQEVMVPQCQENWKKGREKNAANEFRATIDGCRAVSAQAHLKRGPIHEHEFEVKIKCNKCEFEKIDPAPLYAKTTGYYVVRMQVCTNCPKVMNKSKGRMQGPQTFFDPVDNTIMTVRERQVGRQAEKAAKIAVAIARLDAEEAAMGRGEDALEVADEGLDSEIFCEQDGCKA